MNHMRRAVDTYVIIKLQCALKHVLIPLFVSFLFCSQVAWFTLKLCIVTICDNVDNFLQYLSYSLMDMPHGGAFTLESRHLSPLAKACSKTI